jgi:hypothetical protein
VEVSLRVAAETIAQECVEGPLFVAPSGTQRVASGPNEVVLDWAPVEDIAPDVLVGSLPIVWWDGDTRRARLAFLDVPPPEPFTGDDIASMWAEVADSSLPLAQSVAVQGRGEGRGSVSGRGLSDEALPVALDLSRALLRAWPTKVTTDVVWRPPDSPGGREDAAITDRLGGRRSGRRPSSGSIIPDFVARRHGRSTEWGASGLAAAAQALAAILAERRVSSDGDSERPTQILEELATRAGRGARGVDPPLSSWPHLAQATFRSILSALVTLSARGPGSDRVPLSDLWRLYESWISLRAIEAVTSSFGPGTELDGCPWWASEWTVDGAFVRLHAQAQIGATADDWISGHPSGIRSVSSNLIPDILVAVWHPDGAQVLICVDAKQRTLLTGMDPSEVAAAGSKYLWGIRDAADPSAFPVTSTLVASSAGVPVMHDPALSRITAVWITPSEDEGTFAASLLGSLDDAIALVASI